MALTLVQAAGQVHGDVLVGVGGGGMEIADLRPLVGGVAGLLHQLALSGGEAVLVGGVELAGGDLEDHPVQRIAVLALDDDLVVLRHGDDADRADVADDFADGGVAVGQPHLITDDVQDHAVEDLLGRDLLFKEPGLFVFRIKMHLSAPKRFRGCGRDQRLSVRKRTRTAAGVPAHAPRASAPLDSSARMCDR